MSEQDVAEIIGWERDGSFWTHPTIGIGYEPFYTCDDLLTWLGDHGHIVWTVSGKVKADKPNPHALERCRVGLFASKSGPWDAATLQAALEAVVLSIANEGAA